MPRPAPRPPSLSEARALFNRREFLHALGAWGVLAATPRALAQDSLRFADNPFTLGVASGYPLADGATLWTRLAPSPEAPGFGLGPADIPVRWEVAEDRLFTRLAASGTALAEGSWSHAVHVDVKGLAPAREYFYRFIAGGASSAVRP